MSTHTLLNPHFSKRFPAISLQSKPNFPPSLSGRVATKLGEGSHCSGQMAQALRTRSSMSHAWLLASLIWVCGPSMADKAVADGSFDDPETELADRLLAGYRRDVLPRPSPGGKMFGVEVQLALTQITKVSTADETMEFHGWWRAFWRDPRLSWNATRWGVDSLRFSTGVVWEPDVTVYEAVEVKETQLGIQVNSSGHVHMSVPREIKVGCPMVLLSFPYDQQRCNFTVGSWGHHGQKMDVLPRAITPGELFEIEGEHPGRAGIDLDPYRGSQEWLLAAVRVVWSSTRYHIDPTPYPTLSFEFELHRATQTYVGGMVAPLVIVVLIGFFSLLMPAPLSGSRPILSVTILLTTATIYFVASRITPQSNQPTFVGRLYIAALLEALMLVFVAIMTTALNLIQPEDKVSSQYLTQIFQHFDKNHDGWLDQDELHHALSSLGMTQREELRVKQMFHKDENGNVNLDDWKAIGKLTRQADDLAIYHNALVRGLVVHSMSQKLEKAAAVPRLASAAIRKMRRRLSSAPSMTSDDDRKMAEEQYKEQKKHRSVNTLIRDNSQRMMSKMKGMLTGSPGSSNPSSGHVTPFNASYRTVQSGSVANAHMRKQASNRSMLAGPHRGDSKRSLALSLPRGDSLRSVLPASVENRNLPLPPTPVNVASPPYNKVHPHPFAPSPPPESSLPVDSSPPLPPASPALSPADALAPPAASKPRSRLAPLPRKPQPNGDPDATPPADSHEAPPGAHREALLGAPPGAPPPPRPRPPQLAAVEGEAGSPRAKASAGEGAAATLASPGRDLTLEAEEVRGAGMCSPESGKRGSDATVDVHGKVQDWSAVQVAGLDRGASQRTLDHAQELLSRTTTLIHQRLKEQGEEDLGQKLYAGMNSNVQSNAQKMGRHLAAQLDRWAILLLPVTFVVYLVLEFAGVFSGGEPLLGRSSGYSSPHSGRVKPMVEYFDVRNQPPRCFRNFPQDPPETTLFRAAAEQCGSDAMERRAW